MPRNKAPIPEEMLSLRCQLAEWRRNHPPRSRLPEKLWAAAAELARRHGLYRTARALPIDYAGLRSRLQAGTTSTTTVARTPQFLEVRLAPSSSSGGHLELLRVPLTGPVDWTQLLRAWRQSEQ